MATSEQNDVWIELRKPFPKGVVGSLPKPYKRDSPKGNCQECGRYHGLPAVHLDYVGHAAVTDRLNTVVGAANWSLEPLAYDEFGNPKRDGSGNLWCRLTILEASKICVGDGSDSAKELLGDALRNGAMRFGVALDLWSKDELESTLSDPESKNEKPTREVAKVQMPPEKPVPQPPLEPKQVSELIELAKKKGHTEKADAVRFLDRVAGKSFITVASDDYNALKKRVIEDGWNKVPEV